MGLLVAVHVVTALVEWGHGLATLREGLVLERDLRFRVSVGGQYHPLVAAGEVWRLWTSVLLHVDLLHLTLNGAALYALGRVLEPWVGGLRLLAWFLAGGLVGSMVAYLFEVTHSDGASGGVFALLAAAIVLGWELRDRMPGPDRRVVGPWLWGLLLLNLVLSAVVPSIDLSAHLGGLGMGLVLAGGIGLWRHRVVRWVEAAWVLGYALTCAVGWSVSS